MKIIALLLLAALLGTVTTDDCIKNIILNNIYTTHYVLISDDASVYNFNLSFDQNVSYEVGVISYTYDSYCLIMGDGRCDVNNSVYINPIKGHLYESKSVILNTFTNSQSNFIIDSACQKVGRLEGDYYKCSSYTYHGNKYLNIVTRVLYISVTLNIMEPQSDPILMQISSSTYLKFTDEQMKGLIIHPSSNCKINETNETNETNVSLKKLLLFSAFIFIWFSVGLVCFPVICARDSYERERDIKYFWSIYCCWPCWRCLFRNIYYFFKILYRMFYLTILFLVTGFKIIKRDMDIQNKMTNDMPTEESQLISPVKTGA